MNMHCLHNLSLENTIGKLGLLPAAKKRTLPGRSGRKTSRRNHIPVRVLCASAGGPAKPMEVEVKLRLPSAQSHQQVADLLAPHHKVTHAQENIFFDGIHGELISKRFVLRLRFYNGDSRCVVSLKGKAVLADGVSRVTEEEEDADVEAARACVTEPSRLCALDCNLIRKVIAEFGCEEYVCLGGFKNVRKVFNWEGLVLELDETQFEFGTLYEVECETTNPQTVQPQLEKFFRENGVLYSYSTSSKFAIFRAGKLPDL